MKNPKKEVAPDKKKQHYSLKLYIADDEPNSRLARENLKSIFDNYVKDPYRIEEVDVLTDFASALKDRVFVTPSLILLAPEPRTTIIGNLADKEMVISTLRLRIENET